MAEGDVQDFALPYRMGIGDESRGVVVPFVLDVACMKSAGIAGFEERLDLAVVFAELDLVGRLERLHTLDERMIRIRNGHRVRLDGRVRDEATAERLHEGVVGARAAEALGGEIENRVGAMQRDPATAAHHDVAERVLLDFGRSEIACVRDQKIDFRDGLGIGEAVGNPCLDIQMLGQQLPTAA
jgi:hypothetical protein